MTINPLVLKSNYQYCVSPKRVSVLFKWLMWFWTCVMCKVTISAVIWHYFSENCHTRYFSFIQNTLYLIATYVCVEVWQAKIHDHVLQPERKKKYTHSKSGIRRHSYRSRKKYTNYRWLTTSTPLTDSPFRNTGQGNTPPQRCPYNKLGINIILCRWLNSHWRSVVDYPYWIRFKLR